MKTPLNATYSKWATYTPRWPGDLISNLGCYPVVPDTYDDLSDYWKAQAANAEHFANTHSRAHSFYNANGMRQAMLYGAASSGYDAWDIATSFTGAILDHARDLTGERYITTQALARGALDPAILQPDIFSKNDRDNRVASDIAQNHNHHLYVVGPNHREHFTRAIKNTYPILQGSAYEDLTFEVHYWGPFLLHDCAHGLRDRDAAWSNNAPLEQAIALAVQFGLDKPLQARGGMQYDVTDIYGRPVSLLDQAWEAARHVVDIATREVTHDGASYQFRTEKGVALLLTYFMYDDFYKQDHAALDVNKAHKVIRDHYADEGEVAAFDHLREVMLPFIADCCDWPTLHKILDHDPHLKQFWEEQVVPAKGTMPEPDEIKADVLGFVPRGGFDHKKLREKAGCEITFRDPERRPGPTPQYPATPTPLGLHEESFTTDWDPKIFNDRNFARLGNSQNPDTEPDSNRLTREQCAAMVILNGLRDSGKRPEAAPHTLFYIDDADSGERVAHYRHAGDKTTQAPGELGAQFDPLGPESGQTYAAQYGAENAGDLLERAQNIATAPHYDDWRAHHGVGNIVTHSDIKAAADQLSDGYREALDTQMHMAIQQPGAINAPGSVVETVGRRYIDMESDGLVIPRGPLSGSGYRYLTEGVLAALGLTPRPYSGGKYRFEIFMDHDALTPPGHDNPPDKMDLGDVFVHLGLQAKYHLDHPGAPTDRDLLVSTARVCDLLEKVMDPGRRNTKTCTDPKTGQAHDEQLIDLNQVDPEFVEFARYSPGMPEMVDNDGEMRETDDLYQHYVQRADYQAFKEGTLDIGAYMQDPVSKGELVNMLWFYLRADRTLAPQAPVSGRMLQKGAYCFDKYDLRDLPHDYESARDWLGNVTAQERTRIFRHDVRQIEGPAPSVR